MQMSALPSSTMRSSSPSRRAASCVAWAAAPWTTPCGGYWASLWPSAGPLRPCSPRRAPSHAPQQVALPLSALFDSTSDSQPGGTGPTRLCCRSSAPGQGTNVVSTCAARQVRQWTKTGSRHTVYIHVTGGVVQVFSRGVVHHCSRLCARFGQGQCATGRCPCRAAVNDPRWWRLQRGGHCSCI